ncbi:MAG: hypothetical protein PHQ23_09810 [Candidatus Wallbacteria bacterium]|nr:hypothetical protein [Candidatus Wallbacteria bacterium]
MKRLTLVLVMMALVFSAYGQDMTLGERSAGLADSARLLEGRLNAKNKVSYGESFDEDWYLTEFFSYITRMEAEKPDALDARKKEYLNETFRQISRMFDNSVNAVNPEADEVLYCLIGDKVDSLIREVLLSEDSRDTYRIVRSAKDAVGAYEDEYLYGYPLNINGFSLPIPIPIQIGVAIQKSAYVSSIILRHAFAVDNACYYVKDLKKMLRNEGWRDTPANSSTRQADVVLYNDRGADYAGIVIRDSYGEKVVVTWGRRQVVVRPVAVIGRIELILRDPQGEDDGQFPNPPNNGGIIINPPGGGGIVINF